MGRSKYTTEIIRNFVESKDGTLVGEYVDLYTKLHIKCNKDQYEWFPKWNDTRRGQWCPKCSGKAKRTIEDVRELVESKDGVLLSKVYKNAFGKLNIKCNKDQHEWKTTWHDLDSGYWCGRCAGNIKLTIDYIRKFVEKNDGILLSNEYENCYTKLHIRCNKDSNEWAPAWTDVQQGSWCPKCSLGKTQKLLQSILEEVLEQESLYNYRGFDWLRGPKGKQEIDIYFPKLKLAIEYDGAGHFEPIRFGGISWKRAEEKLEYIKKLDQNKDSKIKQHSEDIKYFIRFDYKESITKDLVSEKLKELQII